MVTQVEDKEKELFNKVLGELASLAVDHKLAGLPIELTNEEVREAYQKYLDIRDEPLFKRYFKYMKSPEGRDFFRKTIRVELWKAGFRPKGWEK